MEIAETAPNSHSRTSQCLFLQVRPLTELDVDRVEPNLANPSIHTLPYAVANLVFGAVIVIRARCVAPPGKRTLRCEIATRPNNFPS